MANKDILLEFLLEVQTDIIRNHIAAGQRVTGKTIESFEASASETAGELSAAKHVGVLEKGRRSGKRPPVAVIEQWIKDRGIVPTKGTTSQLAWAIATKISKLGTSLYQRGGRRDIISNVITEERLSKLSQSFEVRFAGLITDELVEAFR